MYCVHNNKYLLKIQIEYKSVLIINDIELNYLVVKNNLNELFLTGHRVINFKLLK